MSNCKKPNLTDVTSFIKVLKTGGINFEKIEKELTCSTTNKGGSKRSKKGGIRITYNNVKYLFITFLTMLSGYLLTGDSIAARGISIGIEGIFSGECLAVQNSIFGAMGFNNPICEIWSGILNQIYNAMRGSPMAITFCWAVLRAIIAGPGDAMMIINGTVERFVAIVNRQYPGLIVVPQDQIENGPLPPQVVERLRIAGVNPEDLPQSDAAAEAANTLLGMSGTKHGGPTGGRKKSKARKSKKVKKSKKAKKAKKSKKSKKSRKTKRRR